MHTDFTNRRLAALEGAFGDTTRSGHLFDIRLSMAMPLATDGLLIWILSD